MTTTVAAISVSLRSTVVSQAKSLATKYTQEGVEYFRTQRNLMGWESFLQELQESSIFCLAQLPYTETGGLEELPQRACTSGEFVDEKDRFQRVAHVTYSETGGQQIITITVGVTWQDSGRPLKSNAAIELRNNFLAQYDPPVFIPSPLPPSPVPTPSPSPLPSPSPSPLPPLFPSGAVIALNAAICPTGWSEFTAARGRVIIGTNPTASGGISARTWGQTGGEETHTLTVSEMPSHDHPAATGSQFVQVIFSGGGGSIYSLGANLGSWSLPVSPTTGSRGGGQAHNNMPPFIALLYCQKD